jgi:hypothetical protein
MIINSKPSVKIEKMNFETLNLSFYRKHFFYSISFPSRVDWTQRIKSQTTIWGDTTGKKRFQNELSVHLNTLREI